ncbi:MAG: hypothetical protein ACRCXC_09545 [Legionella sp.]
MLIGKNGKNHISHADKEARKQCIDDLKAYLSAYDETGNSDELLVFVRKNVTRYYGVYLPAILHKAIAEIGDLDKRIPQNYNADIPQEDDLETLHHHAKEVVATLEKSNPAYATALNQLYQNVENLAAYGDETKNLGSFPFKGAALITHRAP